MSNENNEYAKYFEKFRNTAEAAKIASESMQPSPEEVKKITSKMQPFIDRVNREYIVDQEELDKAIDFLFSKGYILPFYTTPRMYIEFSNSSEKELEEEYLDLFRSRDFFSGESLIELIAEFPLQGWEEPLVLAKKITDLYGIAISYKLLLPFFYSYLESFFRIYDLDRGKETRGFKNLTNLTREFIQNNEKFNIPTKAFYKRVIDSTEKYFFAKFSDTVGDKKKINRNSILHGYSVPQEWQEIDFYKIISLLTIYIYLHNSGKAPLGPFFATDL